jgi:hypothetical protein
MCHSLFDVSENSVAKQLSNGITNMECACLDISPGRVFYCAVVSYNET